MSSTSSGSETPPIPHKTDMPTASAMQKDIVAGRLTPSAILEACLGVVDQHEKNVGAWAFIDRDGARRRAKELDRQAPKGLLHGIPFGIKDNIDTYEIPTDYGTSIYNHSLPPRDAACVASLRLAGANPLGKTVSTELAHITPGKTRNPWNLSHTPGGSSSGSAAAVASGMVPVALGTQTTGSVIRPAAFCGVIGYKPTFGDFNVSGVLANAPSFDTLGVMARCIDDVVLVRRALLDRSIPDVRPAPLADARVGIGRTPFWDHACAASQDLLDKTTSRLEQAGAILSEFDGGLAFDGLETAGSVIAGYEFARTITHERRTAYDRLSEPLREGRMADGLRADYDSYVAALWRMEEARIQFDAAMLHFDFILTPSTPGSAPNSVHETGSPKFNFAWSWLHVPAITLPMTTDDGGLPLGLQMAGRRHQDGHLLNFAEAVLHNLPI